MNSFPYPSANLGNLAEGAANTAMAAESIGNDAKDRADDMIDRAGDVKAKLNGLGATIQAANDKMASSQNSSKLVTSWFHHSMARILKGGLT